jgi:hypothetical protein
MDATFRTPRGDKPREKFGGDKCSVEWRNKACVMIFALTVTLDLIYFMCRVIVYDKEKVMC